MNRRPYSLPRQVGRWLTQVVLVLVLVLAAARPGSGAAGPGALPSVDPGLAFIDTSFENASPVWHERAADGTIRIHLLYDHERNSPNRAAGHLHFCLCGTPGTRFTLEFCNLENVWNGQPGSVAKELKTVVISPDGRTWKPVPTTALPGDRVQLAVALEGPRLYVARVEPYRLSDLERWLAELRRDRRVRIQPIGSTVLGRPLEILRIGRERAPYRVFVRARAHPWESGGNWVVEGLVRRFLAGDAAARGFRERYCLYLLPMANKDGVARGMTRFNVRGRDLNRNWDRRADSELAPENAALEAWLEGLIRRGRKPHLALELHNDGGGRLHVSRPPVPGLARHVERMAVLEQSLRRHTWFTEGSTPPSFQNSGTLGDGWLERYGIDAVVHEFNCNWIEGLQEPPLAKHWRAYGEGLAAALDDYFKTVRP